MSEPQVRMVNLDVMRMICFSAFGESPDEIVLEKLFSWEKADGKQGRVFGLLKPTVAGSPN